MVSGLGRHAARLVHCDQILVAVDHPPAIEGRFTSRGAASFEVHLDLLTRSDAAARHLAALAIEEDPARVEGAPGLAARDSLPARR